LMNEQNDNERTLAVTMAKWGMTASIAAFLQIVLFNPGFGLALPMLGRELWPVTVRVAGFMVLLLVPVGVVLSGISLCIAGFEDRRKALLPALVGLVVGLVSGVPVSYGFLHGNGATQVQAKPREQAPVPAQITAPPQSTAGVFIP